MTTDGDCAVQVNVTAVDTQTIFAFFPLHLQVGVRLFPGTEPWLTGNTVMLIDLTAAAP